MHPAVQQTRRHLFQSCGIGLGQIALGSLLFRESASGASQPAIGGIDTLPHFLPKASRVIYLFMAGAPSQLELFDNKPKLAELEGKPLPPSVIGGQRYAFIQPDAAVLGPRFKFARHGQSGAELSEVLPHTAKITDEIAIIRSMHTDLFNHSPAQLFMNTGSGIPGRPSMGSWLSYGLGSLVDDLPAFVVLKGGGSLSGGASMWSNGFLPGRHQGVPLRSQGDPILNVSNPAGIDMQAQREALDLIGHLNREQLATVGDPEIQTRIDAYEMAFRMQRRAPELMDFSQETKETLNLYGATPGKPSFANTCLLARRLAERGVRFIQVYQSGWDHHSNVQGGVKRQAAAVDQASAALINDLRRRGMLDDTLVIWGGEFGRTPMVEASAALNRSGGRDHHPQAFTVWLAGAGIKRGLTYGSTDELGFHIQDNPVHVSDLQATILHQLGINHKRFSFRFRGLDFRLTGVEDHHVVQDILA